VVVTLPHQLNGLVKGNKKELLSALMRVGADVFKDWIGNKYNIRPGIISVLHTFGETKGVHVHAHMIVSWGGLDRQTSVLKPIESVYVNYGFLKKKFRCKFEDVLISMFDANTLQHHFADRTGFMRFVKQINREKWIIHLEPPMDIPEQVVRYIGRYSKRACLSEYKITNMEGENISFRYKDYKTMDKNGRPAEKIMEMNYRDFFPRLLQHVPLKYFRVVRYYGLYSNRAVIPGEFLYVATGGQETNTQENQGILQVGKTGENPMICSTCKIRKVYVFTKLKSRRKNKTITFERSNLMNNEFLEGEAA
jgi:hypothetical protein